MNNKILLEPMSEYMEDPAASSSPTESATRLPPLVENFRADRDAKVVSKEVYEYLKQRHGVHNDDVDGEGQDVYRLRKADCPSWQHDLQQRYNFESEDDVVRMVIQVPIESEHPLP